jgi:DNA-binding response OmpR family regulator
MSENRKIILIVDDDTDMLDQMKLQVENFGFNVVTATSGKEGEQKLEEIKPDLAIYDLMMETQDSGFILAYKTKKKYPDVPVIIATAVTAETGMMFSLETKEDQNWIKADKYLEKGVRGDQLHREINKLLKL